MKQIITILILTFVTIQINAQGGAAINTTGSAADPSAALDLQFNNKGLLIPRLTTAERNSILNPAEGLLIYNLDCYNLNIYRNGGWSDVNSGIGPNSPIAGTHIASSNQIEWNWNSVSGATGYKYNTSNDYTSAIDNGTNTSYTMAGLSGLTTYNLYVWAYNACGYSASAVLAQTTLWGCNTALSITHTAGSVAPVNKTVSYNTTSTNISGATKCWITQNLGADHQATAATDNTEEASGWYWQFNRMQGYKHDGTTRTPNTTWIAANTENSDWEISKDPCTLLLGTNWRLPTKTEWTNVITGWTTFNSGFASVLKTHAAGELDRDNGTLSQRGSTAIYWTSTQDNTNNYYGWYLFTNSSNAYMNSQLKGNGWPVRCLKD